MVGVQSPRSARANEWRLRGLETTRAVGVASRASGCTREVAGALSAGRSELRRMRRLRKGRLFCWSSRWRCALRLRGTWLARVGRYRALRGGLGRVPQCFRRPAGARKLDCSAWSFSSCSALKLVRQPQLQPPTDDVLVPPRICLMGSVDAVIATVRADVVGPTVPASRPARPVASEMRLDAKPVGGGPASFLAPGHGGCPLRTLCPYFCSPLSCRS